jgi:hypothetical protein
MWVGVILVTIPAFSQDFSYFYTNQPYPSPDWGDHTVVRIDTRIREEFHDTVSVAVQLYHVPQLIDSFSIRLSYDVQKLIFLGLAGTDNSQTGQTFGRYHSDHEIKCGEEGKPIGLIQISSHLEKTRTDDMPVTLAQINFRVSDYVDRWDCRLMPVRFYWSTCEDNVLYSGDSARALIANQIWDENYRLVDPSDGLLGHAGTPANCYNSLPNTVVRNVTFFNGGIQTRCHDDPKTAGDVNLNAVPFEFRDAAMLAQYFIDGLTALGRDQEGSFREAEIDGDGNPATINDFVQLVSVCQGDAYPYQWRGHAKPIYRFSDIPFSYYFPPPPKRELPEAPLTAYTDSTSPIARVIMHQDVGSIEVQSADSLGAMYLVLKGEVDVFNVTKPFKHFRRQLDGNTHVLLVPELKYEPGVWRAAITSGALMAYSDSGLLMDSMKDVTLLRADAATFDGRPVRTTIEVIGGE